MSGVIGALRVDLGMETAAFTKGAKHAEDTLSKLHETLKEYAGKFAAAFAFEKIVEGIHGSIEAMDQLGKTAQKVGIPVEELSKLSLAAKLADTSMETLASSTFKLSKNLELIVGGKGGNAGAALKAIGVSATDAHGRLKPTEQIIADISEKFHNLEDGANKTAIAIALFGKAGAEMIPFLNQGKQGLKEAADLQEKFGLTTQAAADQAQLFDDNLTTLKAAFDGLYQKVSIELLHSLNDFTNWLVAFVSDGGNAKSIADAITKTFAAFSEEIRKDISDLKHLNDILDFFVNGGPEFQAMVAKSKAKTESFGEAMKYLASQTNSALEAQRRFDGLQVNETGKGDLHNNTKPAPNFTSLITNAEKATKTIDKLAAEAARVFESTRTPLEKYNAELVRLNVLLNAGKINHETYNRAVSKSFDDYVHASAGLQKFQAEIEKTNPYLDELKSSFEGFINSAIDGTFNLTDGIGGLLKSFEKMALNSVFQQFFSGGTPSLYGGGGGGGILSGLFKGLLGFADGGTIMPGGSGGIDSQVVAFRKSPNERVDITKPGQVAGGNGASGGSNVTYNIDARGADSGQIAVLSQQIKAIYSNMEKTVLKINNNERRNNPAYR